MYKLYIWVKNDTSLINRIGEIIDGQLEFIDMLENLMSYTLQFKHTSKYLGTVDLKLCFNGLSRDWRADIKIEIIINDTDNNSDIICDLYKQDTQFVEFIQTILIEFVTEINENINQLYFPIDENFIFKDDKYYVEASIYNKDHSVDWHQITLGTDVSDFYIFDPEVYN